MITLKTLPQATAQEVYDQVKAHLLAQNEKSEDEYKCLYRKGDLKCAAGCLIGDDEYKEEFDTGDVNSWEGLVDAGLVPGNHAGLIRCLQWLHDTAPTFQWEARLRDLAVRVGLVP